MTQPERRRVLRHAAVAVLCVLHAWMAASVSEEFSHTFDEVAHVTAGRAYWSTGDFRFHPENGNLPQRWMALPLLFGSASFPDASSAGWADANVWVVGRSFFYEEGNDSRAMRAAARAMISLLSAALCLLIFCWARGLFGNAAGFLALILAAFSPTLLAHGGLATSDTTAALAFSAALLAWWRLLHRITLARLALAGLAAGALATAKFSGALFAPMALTLAAVRLLHPAPLVVAITRRRRRLAGPRRLLGIGCAAVTAGAVAIAVMWAAFDFRYSADPRPDVTARFSHSWEHTLLLDPEPRTLTLADGTTASLEDADLTPGIVQHFVQFARRHHLLPEAYLYGLTMVDRYSRSRLAFFAGEYRTSGWWEFFPAAFLLKTTVPVLLLSTMGIWGVVRWFRPRGRRRFYRLAPLLVLLTVYGAFSLTGSLNIGHRHLLPVYPAVFVLAGAAALIQPRRPALLLLAALAVWHAAASLAVRPHYLAYFNPLGGGPEEAHRLFVDSSLDWGQDLPGLRRWIQRNASGEPVFLSYFGSADPREEGVIATRFGDSYFDPSPRSTPAALTGGFYCFSATMFRRVYTPVRGPWTRSFEDAYLRLREWVVHFARSDDPAHPTELDGTPLTRDEAIERLWRYEDLQFGRLCHYLQLREPDALIGYSILVFRLSDDEVSFALNAPLPVVNAAILGEGG